MVRRVGAGDGRAAAELVRRHLPRLVSVAQRMLGDPMESEDVAQEVFLRVWKEAASWQPGGAKFATWMHRVALNLCYDRLRKRRETLDPDAGAQTPDSSASAGDHRLEGQREASVRAALETLPERQRAAIVLCHFEEMTNIEAAAALEISVDALESLLARGRRALRTALESVARDLMGPWGTGGA